MLVMYVYTGGVTAG